MEINKRAFSRGFYSKSVFIFDVNLFVLFVQIGGEINIEKSLFGIDHWLIIGDYHFVLLVYGPYSMEILLRIVESAEQIIQMTIFLAVFPESVNFL